MNGIKMNDCKFYVDEAARTIVCVIPRTTNMLLDFIVEHFKWGDVNMYDSINRWDNERFYTSLRMPNSFMGKAVCSPDDEWNEETGKIIAFSRAKDNLLKSFFKHARTYISTIDKWLEEAIEIINTMGDKLFENTERRHAYIESLIGTSEDGNKENT